MYSKKTNQLGDKLNDEWKVAARLTIVTVDHIYRENIGYSDECRIGMTEAYSSDAGLTPTQPNSMPGHPNLALIAHAQGGLTGVPRRR